MSRLCNLDHSFLLVNEQATLENIRNTIVRRVAKLTQPGDTVICYISTHGGRCADDNGDEEDGYDEFLVVYDSDIENLRTIRSSVLMDDTFGRWLQALDGRKVIVVTDTCYSAGQATGEKGLAGIDVAEYAKYAKGLPMPGVKGSAEFDFLDGEFARVKDIGQREVALLASAMAAQTAFERREGDLSVMTHCLLELINTSRGPVTLEAAYQYVLREVPKYVEKRFPGTTQTPVLVNHTTPPVYIRP